MRTVKKTFEIPIPYGKSFFYASNPLGFRFARVWGGEIWGHSDDIITDTSISIPLSFSVDTDSRFFFFFFSLFKFAINPYTTGDRLFCEPRWNQTGEHWGKRIGTSHSNNYDFRMWRVNRSTYELVSATSFRSPRNRAERIVIYSRPSETLRKLEVAAINSWLRTTLGSITSHDDDQKGAQSMCPSHVQSEYEHSTCDNWIFFLHTLRNISGKKNELFPERVSPAITRKMKSVGQLKINNQTTITTHTYNVCDS